MINIITYWHYHEAIVAAKHIYNCNPAHTGNGESVNWGWITHNIFHPYHATKGSSIFLLFCWHELFSLLRNAASVSSASFCLQQFCSGEGLHLFWRNGFQSPLASKYVSWGTACSTIRAGTKGQLSSSLINNKKEVWEEISPLERDFTFEKIFYLWEEMLPFKKKFTCEKKNYLWEEILPLRGWRGV